MKIRKQTYSLEQYLKLMKAETIRSDQDCQRLSGQWDSNMVNELIFTVLTDGYIPPIILGEETVDGITRQWIPRQSPHIYSSLAFHPHPAPSSGRIP